MKFSNFKPFVGKTYTPYSRILNFSIIGIIYKPFDENSSTNIFFIDNLKYHIYHKCHNISIDFQSQKNSILISLIDHFITFEKLYKMCKQINNIVGT